jgi:hypothetical protein
MFVELPTPDGSLWVNPAHVVGLRLAEEGSTFLYVIFGVQYTIQLPPGDVAALLAGQTPPARQLEVASA